MDWHRNHLDYDSGVVAITIGLDTLKCTGALIRSNVVLTAGHCISSNMEDPMFVQYNCTDIDKNCLNSKVERKVIYPEYNPNNDIWHDIGLLILEDDLNVQTIELATPDDIEQAYNFKMPVVLAGFGSRPAMYGQMFSTQSTISNFYAFEIFFAETGTNGPCKGDSGGPAMIESFDNKKKVLGVLSRKGSFDTCGGNSRYTSVVMYLDWIKFVERYLAN